MPRLNLGCGKQYLDGWINIDLYAEKVDMRIDLTQPLPFGDGCVSEIRAIHLIEHFSRAQWREVKRDWYRVLAWGGQLELQCPALDACMRAWLDNKPAPVQMPDFWMVVIYGGQEGPSQYHKNGFTAQTLKADLEAEGFTVTQTEILDGWNLRMLAVK